MSLCLKSTQLEQVLKTSLPKVKIVVQKFCLHVQTCVTKTILLFNDIVLIQMYHNVFTTCIYLTITMRHIANAALIYIFINDMRRDIDGVCMYIENTKLKV